LIKPLIVISLFNVTFALIDFLNKLENPPVIIISKDFFVSFLIKLTILSIKPAYPQKKPDLTAFMVFWPITFFGFFRFILGIKLAYQIMFLKTV